MHTPQISAVDQFERKHLTVLDSTMYYIDIGVGDPIVFLHGNGTSSYLWRNVIPHVASLGRCLAPDLMGAGLSGDIPGGSYRFLDHARYLDAWFETLNLGRDTVLVLHDWGGPLGFYWAHRHPERIKALAYMETFVCPIDWEFWPKSRRELFKSLRSPKGEEMVLRDNIFIETMHTRILRSLTAEELSVYHRRYAQPGESRRPTLTWTRECPIGGEPSDVVEIVKNYGEWLSTSGFPKLFVNADPGSILTGPQREFCRRWPNQRETTVKGLHYIQEDSPHEIGRALGAFLELLDK